MSGMNETQNRQIETYNMSALQVFVDPRQLKDRVKIWRGGKDRLDKRLLYDHFPVVKKDNYNQFLKLQICFVKCKVGLTNYCLHYLALHIKMYNNKIPQCLSTFRTVPYTYENQL